MLRVLHITKLEWFYFLNPVRRHLQDLLQMIGRDSFHTHCVPHRITEFLSRQFTNIFSFLILIFIGIIFAIPRDVISQTKTNFLTEEFVFFLSGEMKGEYLGKNLQLLEDSKNVIRIEDFSNLNFNPDWKNFQKETLSKGFTRSSFWIRFKTRYKNRELGFHPWFLELANPGAEEFVIYKKISGFPIRYEEVQKEQNIRYFHPVYRLVSKNSITDEYLIRVSSRRSLILNFKAWSVYEFILNVQIQNILFGLFFGAILVMLIYNGFVLFTVREAGYFFYVLYLLFFTLWQLSVTGVGNQYLFPGVLKIWNNLLVPFAYLAIVFSIQFTRSFLHTYRNTKVLDRILILFMIPGSVGIVLSIFNIFYFWNMKALTLLPVFASVIIIYAGINRYRRGYRPARFFLLAWSVLIVFILVTVLKNLSVLPSNLFTDWGSLIGSLLEMTLLSFALADRFKSLQAESLQTNVAAYENQIKLSAIEQELRIARELQKSILPDKFPKIEGIELSVRTECASFVGGDFYDFHDYGDGRLGVFISDVSGHGIPAAIIASMVKLAFSIEVRKVVEPADLLKNVNRALMGKYGKHFITAAYLIVDLNKDIITYSNAGHPPIAILNQSGELREIFLPGWIMGLDGNLKNGELIIPIKRNDRIVLFTDGVTEARDKFGQMFGYQKFYDLLKSNSKIQGRILNQIVFDTVRTWSGRGDQFEDDITLLILDLNGKPEKLIEGMAASPN
ncbi:7TM diverse intracellular signaling domain-containing protein [Leptospira alstonii]|uniref:Stage II sporulation protein E n=2 Tax=Leptospira alstonii TaxID=28452 RepID=M6CWV3_9LEPT|nr:7TM diverse intracellular signaling domain-containing protein [Leptospira alstonii]EMJ90765.1 stage II sporulation protein E [Leptospira alstonii serovar Sichuan str. 79601]EQA78557.1 7TM diverse intracellular signaling [Leptospira alstonii serovar Pingchang str. 80-412]